MSQWKIIKQLCELVDDKTIVEDEEYKKQREEEFKWLDLLEKYLKEDKKLNSIFYNYDNACGLREGIEQDIYFREGFLCGARLIMEIFGFEREEN